MLKRFQFRLNRGALIRMAADAMLLQAALLIALALRFYVAVNVQGLTEDTTVADLLSMYQRWYVTTTFPLTSFCLLVFYFMGFYTRGETYQSRYKVLVVVQAVSVSFITYISVILFFDVYNGQLSFAKGAMLLAWGISIVLLAGARVWNQIWQHNAVADNVLGTTLPEKDRPVLVIGGGGYIGSALVPMLLNAGHRVRVLDILMFGESPLESVQGHRNLELMQGDFRLPDQLARAMHGVKSIVHLGAIVGDPACNLDESLTIDVNLASTKMIADMACRQGIQRFVFASTCSVYGASSNILDERSEVRPLGIYGITKYASEKVLQELSSATFTPTILRFATIFGFSGRTRFDLVVNLLTAKAKLEGEITVHNGDQWRPFVHVEDAARAVVSVLEAPVATVGDEVFNVGSNDLNYTIREIGELIQQQVISSKLVISETDGDRRDYKVDFSKIRNLLDYRTTWTIEEGIQQVLEAIISGRVVDYRDPQYSNVAFLSREGTAALARDRWARDLIENLSNPE